MSKFISKFTSSGSKPAKSRLELMLNKLTNSSQSSSPSITNLKEISIFSFNFEKLQTINEVLIENFQIIKTSSTRGLHKNLVTIQKTLVIFQYLLQTGSEDFIRSWQMDENGYSYYKVISNLLENLNSIENSNLCQDQNFGFKSSLTGSTPSLKNNVRQVLSSTINKLAKLKNYLTDEDDLKEFRLSFQKLRSDMSKPTPRASLDNKPRRSSSSGNKNKSSTDHRNSSSGLIDLSDNITPRTSLSKQIIDSTQFQQRKNYSRSLDLTHLRNATLTPSQDASLKAFGGKSNNKSIPKLSSPLSRSYVIAEEDEDILQDDQHNDEKHNNVFIKSTRISASSRQYNQQNNNSLID